ncbi:hypothetical protein [Pseudoxanthomonas sp.]|uniref:hypothetical protein n=1 Tax=Pseudoxanthomonas sp. TaxID=1871049 RepID=UPI0026091DD5|nr:hypothetical protein [Pseudoxanthomonas sp.]WDS36651.1 MAG: hypothetical protein O8I58_01655 [Pseudoxanthomonas sp.]
MISLHDASPLARWLLPAVWIVVALLLACFGWRWRRGRRSWALPLIGGVLVVASLVWMSAASRVPPDVGLQPQAVAKPPLSPEAQQVWSIVVQRCQACHSDHATRMTWARFGLSLDSMDDVENSAPRIYKQVVELQAMPMGNNTQMTPEERAIIAHWYQARPK